MQNESQGRIRPLKKWGQHFLSDPSVARRMALGLDAREGDHWLEIGAGKGILTESLLAMEKGTVTAVEIDPRCCEWLRSRFEGNRRFILEQVDFLRYDLTAAGWKWRLVGNIPYHITSPILFRILDQRQAVQDLTVMVQKEVADRITSGPGPKTYGIPSVLFQMYSRVTTLFQVARRAFHPVPQVDSTVLHFRFLESPFFPLEDAAFFRDMVRAVFGQRRKMLKNTLKSWLKVDSLEYVDKDLLARRPEECSVETFAALSNCLVRYIRRTA